MTARKDSDGNPINRDRRSRTISPVNVDSNVTQQANVLGGLMPDDVTMSRHMALWAEHDGGYLKIRRALDSQDLHLTWTWSVGKFAKCYVYVRVEYWRMYAGLEMLYQKVLEVETGLRKPSPDRRLT